VRPAVRNRSIGGAMRLALGIALLCVSSAFAQTWPAKPIKFIVASAPGGPLDVATRGFTEALRQDLGQTFVVEDLPAADGMIGTTAFVRTPPDGYTFLVASAGPISLNPSLYSKLQYDPQKDLVPVVHLGNFNSVILVNAAVSANSLKELFELARAKPNSISFGTAGNASTSYMYVEWFRHARGIEFYNVPYKTNPQALTAVVAGEIQATVFALGSAQTQAKAGKVKMIVLLGDKRLASNPEIPTMKEEGVDLLIRNWFGMFGRTGTPREIIERMNKSVAKAIGDPGYVQKILAPTGFEASPPAGQAPEEFARFLKEDRESYQRVKKEAQLKQAD
jgi:tripartite-type tricarboxylate transporter receptor subunit TctC